MKLNFIFMLLHAHTNSFRYAGAKLWNELPDHFRKDMSLDKI